MMPGAALLVRNHRIQIYIFHAPEDVFLYLRVLRCKCADQVLDRTPFGALLCAAAGSAALCQTTGTLDKMQIIIIIRYMGRISSIPSKLVLWSLGIMV